MKRWHLFEFEDQQWFPDFLRDFVTDFLQFVSNKGKIYRPIVPLLADHLKASGTARIIDLGSGGGGGLLWLNEALKASVPDLSITLTDYYPNRDAFEHTVRQSDNFSYVDTPVDARAVPAHLQGVRTQFLSLHHFNRADAISILQNAVDANAPVAVFEAQERSLAGVLGMFFAPLSVLLTTPLIRPFKLGRMVFTYLLPIVPLVVLWDGIVSVLRTYSVSEMQSLVQSVEGSERYIWNIGKVTSGTGVVQYLVGRKRD